MINRITMLFLHN